MDVEAKSRPFAKLDVAEMRAALPTISGGALKVWLAYRLRMNADGVAWPGAKVLAGDTGLSSSRISKLRAELIRDGWLVAVGCARGAHGTFGAPKFRPVIPQFHHAAKTAHGENTVRQESLPPHGENDSHHAAKTAHEVDSIEVASSEVKGSAHALPIGRVFENRKIPRKAPRRAVDNGESEKFAGVVL